MTDERLLLDRVLEAGDLLAECLGRAVAMIERGEDLQPSKYVEVRDGILAWHRIKQVVA